MIKGIDVISNEFEAVVNTFPSIVSYLADSVEVIDDNTTYPNLLFATDQTTAITSSVVNTGMPKKQAYSCRVLLSDEFDQSEQDTKTLTEKYEELETVLAQYVAKLYRRSRSNTSDLSLSGVLDKDFAQRQHHDNVVRVGCDIEIFIHAGNCEIGTFTDLVAPVVSITADGNSIDLSWTDTNDSKDGFKVYRADSLYSDYNLISTLGSGVTTYGDTDIEHFQVYFYKVEVFEGSVSATSLITYDYSPGQ